MKSELNFHIKYQNGSVVDMHDDLGLWVNSFRISSPDAKRTFKEVPGMDGAYLSNSKMGVRKVTISFEVETDSVIELDDLKHTIFGVFYSKEPYRIIRDIKPDWEIYAVQDGEYDFDIITSSDGEFTIELSMPDPYIYSVEKTQIIDTAGVSSVTLPSVFSEQMMANATNTDSPFMAEITFKAAASEYVLKHVQSGKYIRLLFDFAVNDKVTIYSNWKNENGQKVRKILLNGNRKMTMLDIPNSDFFYLQPGENAFEVPPIDQVETKLIFRERWI
ncbi:distal tail protein Dit [Pseudalkalibacillus caeni]|uniref:Phage tail family protein n=1 Tax=Exobacillus caeni TaxID=2574798 RepID=A0A5R9FDK9_9BACL|nr:distal tail protein Dit [Pseudalkalibacillus caeni]TLS37735.1 phage tail family protein [Pseudalkalibacillus caeni]